MDEKIFTDDGERLRMYILSLPILEARTAVEKISETCKVPVHTVNNWRYGLCRIPNLAKDKIEELFGVKIF